MLYYATIIRAEIKNRDLYSRKLVKIPDLMDKYSVLKGYMTFVDLVRDNISEGKEVRDAVKTGLDTCIKQGILTEFFTKRYTWQEIAKKTSMPANGALTKMLADLLEHL